MVERSPGSLAPLVGEGESTSFGWVGVLYISCATSLRRFEVRDGNSGLTAKDLRLIPLDGWPVADLEGI